MKLGDMTVRESEADFYSWVKDYAHLKGWLIAHFRPARVKRHGVEVWETPIDGDGKGFPDTVLARNGVTIIAELKAENGTTSEEQGNWLMESGGHLWKPSDRETIMRILE